MTPAADIILITGGITLANEALFAPLAGNGSPAKNINWRVIPATGVAALLVSGLDKLSGPLAMGLAVTALITTLFVPFGNARSPVSNLATAMGYTK
jgi:hypothetical protein